MTSGTLRLVPTAYSDPATQALVEQVQAEYVVRYGGPDDTPLEEGVFAAPRGAFFVGHDPAHDGDSPVAMGGWRLRTDVHPWDLVPAAEVKRMYVAPVARRRGFARQVLAHLEATARAAGAQVMVLETGTAQPEAIAMYEGAGYEPVAAFGHYTWSPLARCLGKPL